MAWYDKYNDPNYAPAELNRADIQTMLANQPKPAAKKKEKNFWLDQISTVGGILGGIGGSFVSPLLGTAAGAGAGSALGETLENAIMGEKDLGKNVLQEGITGAIFGAGPIKLAKGAFGGGMALAKGAGMAAAKEAATSAALTPLRQSIGKGVAGVADDLVIKQFRLTPTQLGNYSKKFGEDAAKTISKYGFSSADDIAIKGIEPLQKIFDNTITAIPGVAKDTLKKTLDARVSTLLKSASSDNKLLGKQLQKEANQVIKRFGDIVDPKELNVIRREFDSLVNYTEKVANPARYNVNKRMADGLRETLQKADPTDSLQSVGKELQKLRQLSDIATKQAQLGRGSLPIGLSSVTGGVLGGSGGGPLGAAAGMAAQAAVNSPTGRKLAVSGATKLGQRLASSGSVGQSPLGIAARLGVTGLLKGGGEQPSTLESALVQSPNSSSAVNTMTPSMNIPSSSNIGSQYSQRPQMSSPLGVSTDQIASALMKAYAAGDKPAISQLQGMYELSSAYDKSSAGSGLTLSDAAITKTADVEKALTGLGELDSILEGNYAGGVVQGGLRQFNPFDVEFQTQQASINRIRQIVGKALEGGVLRKEDEEKYKKILPTMQDEPGVYKAKVAQLRQMMSSDLDNYIQMQQVYGKGAGSTANDLTSALMQSQGAY